MPLNGSHHGNRHIISTYSTMILKKVQEFSEDFPKMPPKLA